MILFGRTNEITWGITAAMTDTSDVYREHLSDNETQYLVDGEWRDFKTVDYSIKVKGEDEPVKFELKLTHRGPLLPAGLIKNAQSLFSAKIPVYETFGQFSLAWGGHYPGESMFGLTQGMARSRTLEELRTKVQALKEWRGPSLNIVLADNSGNIGYTLTSSSPMRKHEYPHMGSRMLEGTSSQNDWIKLVPMEFLPFVLNPKKGYYQTANQRIVPENSRFDIGASLMNTGRALRVNEIISEGIKEGKKFTVEDMVDIQQDMTDVIARNLSPSIVKIAERAVNDPKHKFSSDQSKDIKKMIEYLKDFKGLMTEDSIPATVYSYWHYFFYRSLFHKFTSDGKYGKTIREKEVVDDEEVVEKFWNTTRRLAIPDNYAFGNFYESLIIAVANGTDTEAYNSICA